MPTDPAPKPSNAPRFPGPKAEAKWAAGKHFPTKLLGGSTLVTGILGIATGWAHIAGVTRVQPMAGVGLLLIGLAIPVLKGSQSALRLLTLILLIALVAHLPMTLWHGVTGLPFASSNPWGAWTDRTHLEFLRDQLAATGILAGLVALCVTCLRTRRVDVFTPTIAVLGAIACLGFAYRWGTLGIAWYKNREADRVTQSLLPEAVAALHRYGPAHPGYGACEHRTDPLIQTLRADARVRGASLSYSSYSGRSLFKRSHDERSTAPAGREHLYTEFVRLPSGRWGRLELKVILPP